MDRASGVAISQVNGKITRRHSRQKSSQRTDAKGERFSLQVKRWRFPRGLDPQEVETRISRLGELWSDHEQFCQNQIFVAPEALANLQEFVVEGEPKRLLQRRVANAGSTSDRDEPDQTESWTAFGASGRNDGVIVRSDEAEWSPLALWIAEQLKLGVQPVPLPPLQELLESVYQDSRVDYRFGHFARLFLEPSDSHPPTIDDLDWQDALKLLNRLTEVYPSVLWKMPQHHIDNTADFYEHVARRAIHTTAEVRSQKPPAAEIPLIPGMFHKAFREYEKKRETDFTKGGGIRRQRPSYARPDRQLSEASAGRAIGNAGFYSVPRDLRLLEKSTAKPEDERTIVD